VAFWKAKCPLEQTFQFLFLYYIQRLQCWASQEKIRKNCSVNALHQVMPSWLHRSRALSSGTPHPSSNYVSPANIY
jgi:hypothetical protein